MSQAHFYALDMRAELPNTHYFTDRRYVDNLLWTTQDVLYRLDLPSDEESLEQHGINPERLLDGITKGFHLWIRNHPYGGDRRSFIYHHVDEGIDTEIYTKAELEAYATWFLGLEQQLRQHVGALDPRLDKRAVCRAAVRSVRKRNEAPRIHSLKEYVGR